MLQDVQCGTACCARGFAIVGHADVLPAVRVQAVGPDHVVGLGVFDTLCQDRGLGLISALDGPYCGYESGFLDTHLSIGAFGRDIELTRHMQAITGYR